MTHPKAVQGRSEELAAPRLRIRCADAAWGLE